MGLKKFGISDKKIVKHEKSATLVYESGILCLFFKKQKEKSSFVQAELLYFHCSASDQTGL